MKRALAVLSLLVGASGCAPHPSVTRLVNGVPIAPRYVAIGAYEAYLRGALAESAGHDAEALEAFEAAASDDAEAPDIWTRIGALRCRLDPADDAGPEALERALRVDPSYGPAYRALGSCEEVRGNHAASLAALTRAVAVDPGVASSAALARHEGPAGGTSALLALTERYGDDPAAWKALAAWSRAHGEATLFHRAMARALAGDVALRREAALGAEWLADVGHDDEARALAGQAADRVDDPLAGRRDALPPLAAYLAVDDAILAGDTAKVARRLVEVRVPPVVAGLRARLLGKLTVVQPLLDRLAAAEPDETRAVTVLDAGPTPSPREVQLLDDSFPGGGERGDELVDAAFADAAARGLTAETKLSPEAQLELSARRQVAPAAPTSALDTCHRLLALALRDPRDPQTSRALHGLAGAPDRLVAIATAHVALATSAPLPPSLETALAPYVKAGDPLALATALELSTRHQDSATTARLRSALAAVAATDVERKLSAGGLAGVSSRD
jgi:hypothetical protein